MKFRGIIAIFVLCSFLTGCCSIVGQTIFPVTINSNPPAANITVTDENGLVMLNGVTPATMTLTAGQAYFHAKSYQIKFSKPGYGDQVIVVRGELDGWYWGNILFGGLIGMLIIDPLTGKMWKLSPYAIGNLSPIGTVPAAVVPVSAPPAAIQGNGGVITTGTKTSLKNGSHVLQIVFLDQVPERLRDKMVSIN